MPWVMRLRRAEERTGRGPEHFIRRAHKYVATREWADTTGAISVPRMDGLTWLGGMIG
jgi:hypothetical protein